MNALFFALGLQRTEATTAQFIHISIPIITAALAALLLREGLAKNQWSGVVIAVAGVCLIVISSGGLSFRSNTMIGNIFIVISAIIFPFYAVLSRLAKFRQLHAFEMIFIAASSGAVCILPLAIAEYVKNPWFSAVSASNFSVLFAACVIISLFYGGFQLLINHYGPAYATVNLYLLPCFVMFWAHLLLNETPDRLALFGAAIVVIGVWIVTKNATPDNVAKSLPAE